MKKRLMMVMCCGIMILGNLSGCNAMKTKETEYHWPTSTLVKSLPVPESKYGEIVLDAEDSFEIDVFNTSKSQFADYINACKENGFNVDYYGTEDSYDAENKDGYTLSLSYDKRKKTMNIDIYDLDDDTEDTQEPEETEDEKRYGDKRVVITEVEMQNAEGKKQRAFTCGEPITIQVQFHVNEPVEKAMMGFGIFRRDGMHCYGCNTHIDNIGDLSFKEDGTVRIRLEEMDLLEGSYSLDLAIQTDLEEPIDFYREVMPFELYNSKSDIGVVRIPHSWELEEVQKE